MRVTMGARESAARLQGRMAASVDVCERRSLPERGKLILRGCMRRWGGYIIAERYGRRVWMAQKGVMGVQYVWVNRCARW